MSNGASNSTFPQQNAKRKEKERRKEKGREGRRNPTQHEGKYDREQGRVERHGGFSQLWLKCSIFTNFTATYD